MVGHFEKNRSLGGSQNTTGFGRESFGQVASDGQKTHTGQALVMEGRAGRAAVIEGVGLNVQQVQQGASGHTKLLAISLHEFVAYIDFARYIDPVKALESGVQVLSAQTQVIVTFALCGFANLSSIGILLGGLGVMAPTRRKELAELGLKAVLAGTLSNLMSAALAGLFVSL